MTYLYCNNCTKNYWNWTTPVKIALADLVVYFLQHCTSILEYPDVVASVIVTVICHVTEISHNMMICGLHMLLKHMLHQSSMHYNVVWILLEL